MVVIKEKREGDDLIKTLDFSSHPHDLIIKV